MLPALWPPAGVRIRGGGGGGNEQAWHSEASAETELTAVELEGHFGPQFEREGWTRAGGGAGGGTAWSVWRRTEGGERYGFLLVVEGSGSPFRALYAQAGALPTGAGPSDYIQRFGS